MKKIYFLLFIFSVFVSKSYSQTLAPGCGTAAAFCAGTSSTGLTFPNGTNVPSVGGYSCLGSQPNPAWYYLQISQSGNLNFNIRQTNAAGVGIDVDFIAWGPFSTAPTCGTTNLNATTQVGCSYSAAPTENFTINNAIVGQYYMVLMTNFANQPGNISLTQTGGTGATSCDVVCPLTVVGGGVSDCRDNILTANYLNSAQVGTTFSWTFNNTPVTATSGPNFVASPRSNNSTVNTLAYGAGNYCVTARSTGCSSTQTPVCTTITRGVPVPYHAPNDLFACNNSTFNLTQNTNVLLQGLPGLASNYRVYYNLDPIRAQTNAAPRISTSQQLLFSGTEGQIIYATVADNSGVYCYAVAQFVLHFQYCAFATSNTGPICTGSTFNLSATDPGIGTVTYAWTGPNGWSASGQNISNVPCPTGTPPFNYICTATPTAAGGAPLTSTTVVDVNAIPVATAVPVLNSICSGATTDISLGGNVAGTTFAWTATQTNGSGSSAGSGSNIAQTLTASGLLVGTVDYSITPSANNCVGAPIHSIITVNPIPLAIATPTPATICSGSTSNIILTSTPSGASFSWNAIQTDVSGATPGNGTTVAQVLTAPGNLPGTVDYTITPTLNTCIGLPVNTLINVNPAPVATATPVATTICSGNSTNIPLTSLIASTTFSWTVVQNNVTGASAGNGTDISQVLTSTSTTPGTAVYSITPTAGGCVGAIIQVTINVSPLPTAAISYIGTPFCSNLSAGQAVTISGTAAYSGGTFASTSGLTLDATTGDITPSTSTAGSYVVTYTVPASVGCTSIPVTTNIVITAGPTATISYLGTPFCTTITTGQAVTLIGTSSYTGGTFSSTAGLTIDPTTGAINPSTSLAGSYLVTYVIPPSLGCLSGSTTTSIVINSPVLATITYSGSPYCSGSTTANVTLTGATGGVFSGTTGLIINATTGAVDLSSPAGLYTVSYTIAASGGCNAIVFTTQITINTTTIPVTGFSYSTPVCNNGTNPVTIPVTGFTTGGTYASTAGLSINSSTGEINLALSLAGSYTVTYTVPATTCGPIGTNTATIVITNVPTAAISYAGTPFCTSLTVSQPITLTGTNAYTGGTYSSTAGLTIDPTTGAIIPSTSTAGSYVVTYTVLASAGCSAVPVTTNIVITAIPTATISYAGTPFCTTLTTGQAVTLNGTAAYTGGTYSSTVGLTIDATTGAITPSTSTAGNYVVTYTIAAATGCSQVTATSNVVITNVPTAAISYAGTPFCTSLTASQPITLTGTNAYTGGTYSSTAGLTIDAASGAITPSTSTAGSYVVTYTIPASAGCSAVPVTTNIIITAIPTATISYAGTPFCTTLTTGQAVTLNGTAAYTGGTYSSTVGLTIDPTTGAITPSTSTAGNYVVTYTIAATTGCSQVTATTNISITNIITAAISYAGTPFCTSLTASQAVTLTGSNASSSGTYSSTAGLTIDATTGAITPSTSTVGSYVVTYTVLASAGCSAVPATTNIVITAIPTATISYAGTPFCTTLTTGQAVTLNGTAAYTGGTYSSTVGLTIDATTGAITPSTSTAGNYVVTYTIAAATGCSQVTATSNVVITNVPTAAISYVGTPFCTSLTTSQAVTLTGTNAYTGGTYSSTAGLTIDAASGAITPSTSTAGSYVVTYTIPASAGCSAVPVTTNIIITAIPTATISYAGTPFCTTLTTVQAVTLNGTAAYTGGTYSSTVGLTIDPTTGAITPSTSTAGNYVVTYTIAAATGCSQVTATSNVVITNVPTAAISYVGTPFCTSLTTSQAVTLTGTNAYTGGTYSSTAGLTIDAASGAITPSTSTAGSYVVTYTIPASAGCSAVPVTTNIVITAIPTATISYAGTPFCNTLTTGQAVTLNGTAAYTGGTYSSTVGLTIDPTTGAITPSTSTAGNYVVTYTIAAATGCSQVTATSNVVITNVPTAAISYAGTPFCTSLTTSQAVTLTGTNAYTGGTYSSTAGLTIDAASGAITPSTSTAGSYVVTYTIPTSAGCSAVPVTTNIVITAIPTATISYAGTPFCTTLTTGQAVTLNGTAAYTGGTYSSTVGLTIDATTGAITPSTSTAGNYVVTYTIAAATGCSQVTVTATIIINPIPVAIATPSLVTICSLDVTNISLTSNAIGTTYAWTSAQNNVTGASSGNGTTIMQALTATSSTPGTVVYTITPSGSGCTGLPITATVTVNPLPIATISGNTTICFGTSSVVDFAGTPNATVTYTVNGGSNQTLILDNLGFASLPTGNLTTTTTYRLVSVVSSGIPACSQLQSGTVTVTVVPTPLVNSIVSSPSVCSGQSTGISLSSNVISSTFNWTVTQSGALGASAGSGTIISQNLIATGVLPGFVIYSITANVGTCQGPATPITITVNPIPVVTTSTILQSVCSGSLSPILLTSNVIGTVFNWNVVQTNVTGATNGSGNIIAQTLTTTSNNIGEAVYSITPLVGGCPGVPKIVIVNVNPIPVSTANAALTTICSSGTTNIALTSTVAGTTFSWTVIQSGIFGASSGSGTTIAQTLTTVGSNQGTVRYTITPTFNGCSGALIIVTITVNPTPEVFGSSASTICSGESPSISLFPSIAATTFAWNVSQMNVTGAQAGTGVIINDVLTANQLGTAIYNVTPTANNCSGTPLKITITVNPAPLPQMINGVICVDQTTNVSFKNYIFDTQLSNSIYDFAWYLDGVIINGAVNNTYEADESGTYSVVVTNTLTGCKSVMTSATVIDSYPGLTIDTTQSLAFSDNATIEVTVTGGNATLLYSLDNGPTQTSNIFTDVDPGTHSVVVTDTNGCTYLTKIITIIGYPTYFTPNGDGFHDTWNIVGLGASAKVFIFDRYGKLVKQISPTGEGWDGTLNGEPLTSTDYWFTVDYTEDYPTVGTSKVFKSHFSLKR